MRIQEFTGADWSSFDAFAAFRCAPMVGIPVFLGVFTGHARPGVMVAAGAFSVGFGSFQKLHESHLWPMALAAFGMCISSWAGTRAGNSSLLTVLACTMAAVIYANAFRLGRSISWVALQCAIWLAISTAYPAKGLEALTRGSLILVGGSLQIVVVALWQRLFHKVQKADSGQAGPSQVLQFVESTWSSREWHRFALRTSVTTAIAAALYQWLSVQNGYWIPVTTLIVIRPDLRETVQRGLARGLGTIGGLIVAGIIVALGPHSTWGLAAGTSLFAWGSYALFQVSYAYFAASLTGYVVFLLSLAGIHEKPLLIHRVLFTACGVALALAVHWMAAWLQRRDANRAS